MAREVLVRMTDRLFHRGPDSSGYFLEDNIALGFRRLRIIDPGQGDQPLFNEDGSIVLMCNGEIYNYKELRNELIQAGHVFRTRSDSEVLLHLYEEDGENLLNHLNGQFAFVLYDRKEKKLLLARDHFGINPLFYTVVKGLLIFASEIKAILEHPLVPREVDLTGLDQILSFPGLVSPRTVFKGIQSLKCGHFIVAKNGDVRVKQYWDLDYPRIGEIPYDKPESYYVERVKDLFTQSVKDRLQADVPVGFYLSGGLDSSMVAATAGKVTPDIKRHSFSIGFQDKEISESRYQSLIAKAVGSKHHTSLFDWSEICFRLPKMIYHCECPVKESYNTCSLALSEASRKAKIPVILTGQGADEFFAGYLGYRFDQFGIRQPKRYDGEAVLEEELREQLWGDRDLFYENDQYPLREIKSAIYSPAVNELFQGFDCLNFDLVDKGKLRGRHFIHQRSYLDFKLRLSDHLLGDHGDRMGMANSVELRHPFLDIHLVEFVTLIPPDLKLNRFTEKYVLKQAAAGMIPQEIIRREKFGFRAPGSSYLLKQNVEWVNDLLSTERLRRQGYFDVSFVETLKQRYRQPEFTLNAHTETDLLMIVLTFGILLDQFELPSLN